MTVLITGALGGVAAMLLPALHDAYELRLTDRRGSQVPGDLTDPAFVDVVTKDIDAVVHLAGYGNPAATWSDLADANANAVAVLLEAAARNGVRRVVLASSVHTMGGYGDTQGIDPSWTPSPCCLYGATKVFAEAAARASYHRSGLSTVSLRLGGVWPVPPAMDCLDHWLAPADMQQLMVCALEADIGFGIYHGISGNTGTRWNYESTRSALGYKPTEDAQLHLAEVPRATGWDTCTRR
jgi:nucleoside-diphosphate-sugar epimerase